MTRAERIIQALIGYGIDTDKAKSLMAQGQTLTSLKGLTTEQMTVLEIPSIAMSNIRKSGRPPIPSETVHRLLLKTRSTCSRCHHTGWSVTIHHIDSWSKTKNHDEENLIVLCLNCHGEAHTVRELGKKLTAELLRKHKKDWEERVEKEASRAVLGLSSAEGGHWDYLNQVRLLKLADGVGIAAESLRFYAQLLVSRKINKDGSLLATQNDKNRKIYVLEGEAIIHLYLYLKDLIAALIQKLPIIDVSNAVNKTSLRALARPGDFIFFQGPCYFKSTTSQKHGPGQWRSFLRRINDIRIMGGFDAWEATSTSCWSDRLCGRKVSNVFGIVESVEENNGLLLIRLSCLAIGSYFRAVYQPAEHPTSFQVQESDNDESEEV